ncbi:MAG: putative Sec-independent protein translocase (twin-arginine translocation protein) [Bacteroidetes bacterium]|jgi:sec-independent protein translocase protein TatA|nr:putative Sec-independent protein translocase (twin-arginine translocation protein) [Bacteroidota bacterium]
MINHTLLFSLGPTEIILIVAVVLLLFGGRKIPELMKGLGQGMREFKKATKADADDFGDKNTLENSKQK